MASNFHTADFIRIKRDGGTLSAASLTEFVSGIVSGHVKPEQISAFAMAVFFKGMTVAERTALTLAMRDSGDTLDWTDYGFEKQAPIVDKHSTGGVGDKVSLMLVPLAVACGAYVPMISGRGLGHTGGTLDKLQSIPGYDPFLSVDRFVQTVKTVGGAIVGQTARLAPADKLFYAVRDVTATVDIIPLITASILSKKLAAGLNALVMDIKVGTGAFMQTLEKARELARSIVMVAATAEVPTRAVLTDMNAVLGHSAGNAVEILEVVDFLKNPADADPRLMDVVMTLAAHMAVQSGAKPTLDDARKCCQKALVSGEAAEIFARMVVAQGGPATVLDRPSTVLPQAPIKRDILAKEPGFVAGLEPRSIGVSVIDLGGGRLSMDDKIDHRVGFNHILAIGTKVSPGDRLAQIHAVDEAGADRALAAFRAVLTMTDESVSKNPVILDVLEAPN